MSEQGDWRFCHKCNILFFDGFPDKGDCPGGGAHEPAGFNFHVPFDIPPTDKSQGDWRFCHKCHGMFFDGRPDKGICRQGGGHEAMGFNFTIPHSIGEDFENQGFWRFCQKCVGMFFDGFPDKGDCPRGGGHEAAGFNFVLPHPNIPFLRLIDEDIRVSVSGGQFTARSRVQIDFNIDTAGGGFRTSGDNPRFADTDENGSFGGVIIDVQSDDGAIAVKGTDVSTGKIDSHFLRGGG